GRLGSHRPGDAVGLDQLPRYDGASRRPLRNKGKPMIGLPLLRNLNRLRRAGDQQCPGPIRRAFLPRTWAVPVDPALGDLGRTLAGIATLSSCFLMRPPDFAGGDGGHGQDAGLFLQSRAHAPARRPTLRPRGFMRRSAYFMPPLKET